MVHIIKIYEITIYAYSLLDVSLKKIIINIKCTSDCVSWLLHPIHISDDILIQSLSCSAKYVKSKYISSYYVTCNVKDNSYIQIAYNSDIFVDALLSIQILYWFCHVEQHG